MATDGPLAPPANLDGQHPAYGHTYMAWWQHGRMQTADRPFRCIAPGCEHVRELTVHAELAEGERLPPPVPDGALAWAVLAGAPDEDGARASAFTVGKALGWTLNPNAVARDGT